MVLPISESMPELSVEERLERARPKDQIISSAVAGGVSNQTRELLYDAGYSWVHNPQGKEKKK